MELKDTIEMMTSPDYKERFKAEYYQTKIRYQKLCKVVCSYDDGTLDFTPTCDIKLLKMQKCCMENYLLCMMLRASEEGIVV